MIKIKIFIEADGFDIDEDLIDAIKIDEGCEYLNESSEEDSFNENKIRKSHIDFQNVIKGLFDSINYSQMYLRIKHVNTNEKYIILFADLLNIYQITDENIDIDFNLLKANKDIIFYSSEKIIIIKILEIIYLIRLFIKKFNEKSQIINLDNMKEIKKILSINVEISDEIIFPNEIYNY